MKETALILVAAAPLFLAACPGNHTVHGRVISIESRAPGSRPAEVISEATITIQCPTGVFDRYSGYTEANGQFRIMGVGPIDDACVLIVEKRGYRPRQYSIAEICATAAGHGRCRVAFVRAELTPLEAMSRRY